MLFTEISLLERPAAAKAAGFEAVELWWPFSGGLPSDSEVDRFVDTVESAGVTMADWPENEARQMALEMTTVGASALFPRWPLLVPTLDRWARESVL
jgi:hydroxypyruvate isomerase